MKNSIRITIFILLFIILCVIAGCDDDNDNGITTEEEPILAIGSVFLRPYLDFACSFQSIDGEPLPVERIIFADSICEIGKAYYYVYGNNYSYHGTYFNTADSNRFRSGDTAIVTFYESPVDHMTITSVPVKLLEVEADKPVFTIPVDDTTINRGDSLTIRWNKVDNADWYGVSIHYWWDSLLYHLSYDNYDASTDTFFTINTDTLGHDVSITFHVMAVTGSFPGSGEVNINGKRLYGPLYSCSDANNYIRITVGEPTPLVLKAVDAVTEESMNDFLTRVVKAKQ